MNACRILHEAGAAGKSACSFRAPAHAAPRGTSPGRWQSRRPIGQCSPAPPAPQPRRWRAFRGTVKKGRQDLSRAAKT
jgi:hypothetical protein